MFFPLALDKLHRTRRFSRLQYFAVGPSHQVPGPRRAQPQVSGRRKSCTVNNGRTNASRASFLQCLGGDLQVLFPAQKFLQPWKDYQDYNLTYRKYGWLSLQKIFLSIRIFVRRMYKNWGFYRQRFSATSTTGHERHGTCRNCWRTIRTHFFRKSALLARHVKS